MKKTIRLFGIFVLMFSMTFFMSSCKKDVKNLPGKWRVISAVVNGDSEDVNDVWIFNSDGSCTIECNVDDFFDDFATDVITFNGKYTTNGNKTLNIESENFLITPNAVFSSRIVYNLDIELLNKKDMMVSGTVKFVEDASNTNVNYSKNATVSLMLSKQ